MSGGDEVSVAGLPLAIKVLPQASNGGQAACPFLVHFPTGFVPGKGIKWKVYRHKARLGHFVLVAHTRAIDFVGSTHGSDRSGPPPCVYALGVIGPSGSMEYARVEAQQVVRMEPRLRGVKYGADSTPWADIPTSGEGIDARLARKEATKRLVEEFGSTRRKRQLADKDLAVVTLDSIDAPGQVTALLDAAHAKAVAGGTTKADVLAAVASSRNVPPHDPTANIGTDAYSMREIIPAGAWHALDTKAIVAAARAAAEAPLAEAAAASSAEGGGKEETAPLPSYVKSRLWLLIAPGVDKQAFKQKAKALGWLSALLTMYSDSRPRAPAGIPALARKKHLQEDVLEALLDLFYMRGTGDDGTISFNRPDDKKTLMLHYVFVVALLVEDCSMQPSQFDALRKQLRMKASDVAMRFRELGATTTPAKLSGEGSSGQETRQYHVALLPKGAAGPTLAESFPKLKTGRKNASR